MRDEQYVQKPKDETLSQSVLLLDYLPDGSECVAMQAGQNEWLYIGSSSPKAVVEIALTVDLATVEDQARILDWLRQNEIPDHVICGLENVDFEGPAAEFLQAKIIGMTRIFEAVLSLKPEICWHFVITETADVWSRACEAYFRVLRDELSKTVPGTRIQFLSSVNELDV